MIRWLINEAYEKINVPGAYRKLKELGAKHGRRFFIAALLWEIVEDVVFPFISWRMGVPELIPLFLVLHFEPIVYPVFFWGFRMWDRAKGREPWEPERSAQSAYWRSVAKVMAFQLAAAGWLSHMIPWKPLAVFVGLTTAFGFVHERIWHDANFGILPDDSVQAKRTLGKTGTYLLVSTMTLYPLLRVAGASPIWKPLFLAQGVVGLLYVILEAVWAKSAWGVTPVQTSRQTTTD